MANDMGEMGAADAAKVTASRVRGRLLKSNGIRDLLTENFPLLFHGLVDPFGIVDIYLCILRKQRAIPLLAHPRSPWRSAHALRSVHPISLFRRTLAKWMLCRFVCPNHHIYDIPLPLSCLSLYSW